ncbi:hypothetical protein KKB06_00455 [Patescibacteria group bacterium]|nr:hypothetical protein [Patescibacteria group bacterium]
MRLGLKVVLLLIIAALVFRSDAEAAIEIDRGPIYGLLKKALPFKNLEIAGYLKNETSLRTAHGLDEFMKMSNIINLEGEYSFSDNVKFFTILRWFYDAVYELENKYDDDPAKWESKTNQKLRHPEKSQWLRECYLDILTDRVDFRLGKQQVVWGTADGVRVLDIVNPLDYREWTLKDYVDTRIPLWMINIEASVLANAQLQLLLIPDYEANYYAPAGAPFTLRAVRLGAEGVQALTQGGVTVNSVSERPERTIRNTKLGLRWRQIIEGHGFEYTLNYLNTYGFASSAYTQMIYGVGPPTFSLTRRAEQINVLGGTFSKTITEGVLFPGFAKGWTLRGEFAYITGDAMNIGTDKTIKSTNPSTVDVNQYNYVLGFDKSFLRNWLFSFQFIQMWTRATEQFDTSMYTLLNGATRGPLDSTETILTLLISTDFMHERLKPQVLILYGDDNDWRISPKISYEFSDQWLGTFGLHIFEGKEQHLSGQFDKNDQVFAEIKYTF